MSRSAFASRFTELVGESAMHYVTRWQMNAARLRFADRDETVVEIAHLVGYDSEAAFNRAFKRDVEVSPLSAYVSRLPLLRPDTTLRNGVDNSPLTVCLKPLDKNFAESFSPQRVAGGGKIPGIAHRSYQHAVILCSGFGSDAGAESFFA